MPHAPQHDDDAVALPADAVEVAKVLGAWGIKGGIRVAPYSSSPQALFSTKRWYLLPPEGPTRPPAGRDPSSVRLLRIVQAREHGDGIVAMIDGLADRNAAEALKGARIFVPRASFPTAEPDEFYWVDLIGLQVINREAMLLGRVSDLLDTGAHSVLRVVTDEAGMERLIPFVSAYVDQVDLAGGCIRVDWSPDWDEPARPAAAVASPKARG